MQDGPWKCCTGAAIKGMFVWLVCVTRWIRGVWRKTCWSLSSWSKGRIASWSWGRQRALYSLTSSHLGKCSTRSSSSPDQTTAHDAVRSLTAATCSMSVSILTRWWWHSMTSDSVFQSCGGRWLKNREANSQRRWILAPWPKSLTATRQVTWSRWSRPSSPSVASCSKRGNRWLRPSLSRRWLKLSQCSRKKRRPWKYGARHDLFSVIHWVCSFGYS